MSSSRTKFRLPVGPRMLVQTFRPTGTMLENNVLESTEVFSVQSETFDAKTGPLPLFSRQGT